MRGKRSPTPLGRGEVTREKALLEGQRELEGWTGERISASMSHKRITINNKLQDKGEQCKISRNIKTRYMLMHDHHN